MAKHTDLDDISGDLSVDKWIGKIKVWPESTSTSPPGFHLTYSKALVANFSLDPTDPEDAAFEARRTALITWQVQLLNLALTNSYSFDRWKNIVNFTIQKEPNNYKIHWLHVIHLYKHDFNLILGVKWRHLICQSTCTQRINPGQYGGVPGRDALQPTIIEELQYKISQASRRPLVHMDYNATACYDCIVISLGSLIAGGFGQHRNIVFVHARTLVEARYLLKTQLGVSDSHYSHCTVFPIHGSGQGSGNSPAIWCCSSSVLFDLYKEAAHGAYFQSPDGKTHVRVFMIGFVDDTSGSINDFLLPKAEPICHYLSRAQHNAQRWNDILQLSGGALEATKCSYHCLHFSFTASGLPVLQGGTFDPPINISFTPHAPPTPLLQLAASTSHKTLGHHKSPSGSSRKAFATILQKNTQHASIVARSPFNCTDTRSYYHSIYLPSITYPFPTSLLSSTQCTQLQVQIKQAVLPKNGSTCSTPNTIIYGPALYGGLEFRDLSIEKSLASIQALLTCLRSDNVPNKLALIALSWAQLLAGTSKFILHDTNCPLGYLEPMVWIPSIQTGLALLGCTVEISNPPLPCFQRDHDACIMDIFNHHPLHLHQSKTLNACCLYLQVTLLSDMCTADGRQIRLLCLHGICHHHYNPQTLMPYQDRPHKRAWQLWRKCLWPLLSHPSSGILSQALGQWRVTGSRTAIQWPTYLDTTRQIMFLRKHNAFEHYTVTQTRCHFSGTSTRTIPNHAVPADVVFSGTHILLLPYSSAVPATIHCTP